MNKLPKKPRNENMYKAILSLNSVEECMRFFDDLCTVGELMTAVRIEGVKLIVKPAEK